MAQDSSVTNPLSRPSHPQTVDLFINRELRAVELRAEGKSFDDIATELGYANKGGAHKAFTRGLTRYRREDVTEVRELELLRLDMATKRLMDIIVNGNSNQAIRAVDTFVRVSERRSRLQGLDKPIEVHAEVEHEPIRIQVVEDVQEFARIMSAVVEQRTGARAVGELGDGIVDAEVVEDEAGDVDA